MRQRRFRDAAERYSDLLTRMPTDLWAMLGRVSALECAGQLDEARTLLEQLQGSHRRSASFQRFRHLFLVRREDFIAAAASQRALRGEVIDEGADDQLGDLYFNQGRYHEARGEFTRLIAAGGLDASRLEGSGSGHGELKASVLARLGACLRQLGDTDEARECLQQALALDPNNHWVLSELAESERALGDVDEARRRYTEALHASPDDHWTRGHLAQLEFEDGNREAAVALYEQIIAAEPTAAWAHVELAQALTETDVPRSTALCATALDLDPKNPWAHAQLGALARRAGNLADAREHYQRAHQGAPSAIWVLHELADTCRHLGRKEEAYGHLERARAEDPYHAVTYGYYGDFLRHDGREAEALAHLTKAIELDPAYAWAWRERAELTAQSGRHIEADAAYREACELEPDAPINDGLKAFLLRCQGRRDLAVPYLERALERHPTYLWAWRERLEHLLSEDRAADAEIVGLAAIKALPDCAPLWGMLAEARRRLAIRSHDLAKRAEAIADVGKALALEQQIPQLWAIQAELAAESGDLGLAERAARTAVELADQQLAGPEYRALLAQVLVAANKVAEAEALLDALMQRVPPLTLQPAWELAAVLAERRGDLGRARDLCTRAMAISQPVLAEKNPAANPPSLASDARLRVRRARLEILLGADAAVQATGLLSLFETRDPAVPWRDAAHIFAQGGRPIEARRAGYLVLESAGTDEAARLRARLHLAELELALGHPSAANAALAEVFARDPNHVQARILGAALADHRGDLPAAMSHLRHVEQHLRSTPAAELTPELSSGAGAAAVSSAAGSAGELPSGLLRQLAVLHERAGDGVLAAALWDRLQAQQPEDLDLAAERCAFRLRHFGFAATSAECAAIANRLPRASAPFHALLREAALAATRGDAGTPQAGVRVLLEREADLDLDNRLLLVRLALAGGELETANRQLDAVLSMAAESAESAESAEPAGPGESNGSPSSAKILPSREQSIVARLLRARVQLALGDPAAACITATSVWDEHLHAHEEAATIIGECHACRGRFADVLAVLDDPALPAVPSLERALLGAVVALEEQGEPWALARLNRHGPPSAEARQMPLVRLLIAAWPKAWAVAEPETSGSPDLSSPSTADLLTVPPFPRLAVRLAQAFQQAQRSDLAASHLESVLRFHRSHGAALTSPLDRMLRPATVDALCRADRRAAAWVTAFAGVSLRGVLRCLCFWK